ncbi:hypothetical protein LAW13_20160, partial [Escherichia coli]|nr:hypothetical protein [Escherichia coli]
GGKNSLNRLIRCVCGKKIGPDPRNFNQRVSLGRNDLLIRTFPINNPQNIVVAALDIFKILYQVLKIISSPLPIPFCMVSSEDEKKNMINIDSW